MIKKLFLVFLAVASSAFAQSGTLTSTYVSEGRTRIGNYTVEIREVSGGGGVKEFRVSMTSPAGTNTSDPGSPPWATWGHTQMDLSAEPITHTARGFGINTGGPYTGNGEWQTVESNAIAVRVTLAVGNSGGGFGPTVSEDVSLDEVTKKVRIALSNTSDRTVNYQVLQDGEVIGTIVLAPGQSSINTITVPRDSDVQVVAKVNDLFRDGDVWTVVPGAVYDAGTVATVKPHIGNSTPPTVPVPEPDIPKNPNPPNSNTKNKGAPVWQTPEPVNDPAAQKDLLTNSVYREGVSKQVTATNDLKDSVDDMKDNLKKIADAVPADASSESDANARASAITTKAASYIEAAKTQIAAKSDEVWADKVGNGPTMPTNAAGTISSSSNGWPSFDIPMLGHIELSPSRLPWVFAFLNAARELVLWFLIYHFIRVNLTRANEYDGQLMTVNPAPLTVALPDVAAPILGQFIQWAKSAVTALLVVYVIIGAYSAAVLAMNTKVVSNAGVAGAGVTSAESVI